MFCNDVYSKPAFNKYKKVAAGLTHNNTINTMATGCSPISTLPCSGIKVNVPFSLSFTSSVANTLTDKTGQGTGFTTVNTYSGTRTVEDGQPTNTSVPGYEPSKITLGSGQLQLVAGKGIDYLMNNNQINVLGVKIKTVGKLQLDVKVINPVNGTDSQQGGIWYGLNDKTYIKLGITGNKVELRKEKNDVSASSDQRITTAINKLNIKTVQLRMIVDSVKNTVEGFYSIDGGVTYVSAGNTYSIPSLSITGMGVADSAAYAGIFATYRNGTAPVTYTYDDFAMVNLYTPPAVQSINIDFLPTGTSVPTGYTADNGLPFDATRKFGWISSTSRLPASYSANMRLRTGTGDAKQLSVVQMQAATDNTVPGVWEYAVANGTYRVTVSAGDNNYYNSDHQINVEGLPTITDFIPTSSTKFRVSTSTVQVSDGRLTIDATGGVNTKMTYLTFAPVTAVTDVTAPVASARLVGTLKSANVYNEQVQVFATATDAGGSGLKSLQYAINGGTYINYTAPFVINTAGDYSLVVKAVDANNNEKITSAYTFSIYKQPVVQSINIDFLPSGTSVPTGYTADNGLPFDATRKFGWISSTSRLPASYSANMRLRTGTSDAKQLSVVQMQAATDNTVPGVWEYAVANGTYRVTVSAGDNNYYNSDHQINVEGLPTITDFIPTSSTKFRVSTSTVQVRDGKLTIDATGGVNTKMTYLTFAPVTAVTDVTAPVVSARLVGTLKSANVYNEQVQVFATATDAGGSGLKSLQYAINGGTYINYTAPFVINTAGDYSLVIKAVDANNNEKITNQYTFSIYKQPVVQATNIDFLPAGAAVAQGFTPDTGLPFDTTRKFGWLSAITGLPSNYSANMRLRTDAEDPKQLSIVQMQSNTDNVEPGIWEYVVTNGLYTVIVSAGDNDSHDSDHQINVEGLPAVSDFIPSSMEKFRRGIATVQVSDGKLTVNATGGINTKMTYLTFYPTIPVSDTVAPVTVARFVGSQFSPDVYNNQVQVLITAADEGGSGLAVLQYSLNGGAYINYTAPFVINTPGDYNLTVRAVDANNNEKLVSPYNFTVIDPNAPKILSFTKDRLSFTILKGQQVISQSVTLITSPTTSTYSYSQSEASWLTLPAKSRNLTFGPANISANMEPGDYQALVTSSADGYQSATLLIDLHVIESLHAPITNLNFQDPATVPPISYNRDYGQSYGTRTGPYQSAGLEYGWRNRSDGSLLDLTLNGRNRSVPDDILLATLMHMQANHITSTFAGTKTEGYWEMKVPNGIYDVAVSVGDGTVNTAPEYHSINIEGVNVINKFVPNGKKGTISRFKSASVQVAVADEYLTINADGGTNTKINSVNISPVSLSPYLFWASRNTNILIKKGGVEAGTFSIVLGSSNSVASNYTVTATYGAGATGWLAFNASPTGEQANLSFDYSSARSLAVGIYKATIKATSGGFTSAVFDVQLNVVDETKPYVIASSPANGSTNVNLSTVSIAANNLHIPVVEGYQGGVNNSTIDSSTVKLLKIVDGVVTKVAGVVQGTGGGDVVSFSPSNGLEANTVYKFIVTSGVKSYTGDGFSPYEATFTTAAAKLDSSNILNAQFTKVPVPGTQNKKYCSLTVGPDGRFYALRLDGAIERYDIDHTSGMLSGKKIITTLGKRYGNRSAIGLVFDPKSTASNLIAWVTHSSAGLSSAPAFDGNISRLVGDSLQTEQLMVTKLPRSKRDHLTNSIAFGPDSALYICQGSMSSAGSYDGDWQRDEVLLSGAVLRLDITKLMHFDLPLNVQTTSKQNLINNAPAMAATMSDSTYNPYGSDAPLTIYASGVRNPYDLVWHTNGQLYLPTNGSGGGGNSPASITGTRRPNGTFYAGVDVPASTGISVQHDWLFRVNPARPVGYFGHPNPLRGEYVLNRGFTDNSLYLPTVAPDANYRPAAYDFGLNNSPNGALEYKSNTFKGALQGKLLVCRFSGGGDIAVMEPGSKINTNNPNDDQIYDIVKVTTGSGNNGLIGMSGFGNPLDIVEDTVNGNLYVIEYNWNDSPNLTSQITLLRAEAGPAVAVRTAASYEPVFNDVQKHNKKYDITISNKGGDVLKVKSIRIEGADASKFRIAEVSLPSDKSPLKIRKNGPVSFKIYARAALANQPSYAKLVITSTDDTETEVDLNDALETNEIRFKNAPADADGIEAHSLQVYPNPNYGLPISVQLKKFNKREPVSICLYDKTGNIIKTVKAETDEKGEYTTQITTNTANKNSYYIIRVTYLSGFKFAKVINMD